MWLDRQEAYLAWAGIVSAFLLSLAFLITSGWLISQNHEISGTILGTVDLVALATIFITRQRAETAKYTDTAPDTDTTERT